MSLRQFNTHQNFYLHTKDWEEALHRDIIKVLESVITEFYENLDEKIISRKNVHTYNSINKVSRKDRPEIIKGDKFNLIYISPTDRDWCRYSYQFTHELCHHVIDSAFFTTNDKFGWFEEALCELASIYCLDKMSQTWVTNPPYSNWKGFSKELANYANNILEKPENKISKAFKLWLLENLDVLYIDRYKRIENRIIALELVPLFISKPELWTAIQYLKFIPVTNEMTFENFIDTWTELVPEKLKTLLNEIKSTLID